MNDRELLQRYATSRCEAAFTELVKRYVGLVYLAALWQVGGDTHLAHDVTQAVFTDLARKAASLPLKPNRVSRRYIDDSCDCGIIGELSPVNSDACRGSRRFGLAGVSLNASFDGGSGLLLAASEAMGLGYGGVSLVSRACGLSRVTITKGIGELAEPPLAEDRVRHEGGGRWRLVDRDPRLTGGLDRLVEPLRRGDPESPLRWTCKSTRTLARELTGRQHAQEEMAHLNIQPSRFHGEWTVHRETQVRI